MNKTVDTMRTEDILAMVHYDNITQHELCIANTVHARAVQWT